MHQVPGFVKDQQGRVLKNEAQGVALEVEMGYGEGRDVRG
jgi:hypothetical protein